MLRSVTAVEHIGHWTSAKERIHTELQAKGLVGEEEYRMETFVLRQELIGADLAWAARYQFVEVLLY